MSRFLLILLAVVLVTGFIFIFSYDHKLSFSPPEGSSADILNSADIEAPIIVVATDLPPQQPLINPPEIAKAIYLTGWSAGSSSKIQRVIELVKNTELNSVIVDVKDYSGYVSYEMDIPEVEFSGAGNQIRIVRPNTLIKQLHDNNIYVIARITVFQDPIFAASRPDLAIKDKNTGEVWRDQQNLEWLDPTSRDTWDYVVAIANDAISRGFDEINFDYIRFPSDGNLASMEFPFYEPTRAMREVLKDFFAYLREHVEGKISADIFGLTTVASDDLGIGQLIEDAAQYFDYVSPMVYPSHYANGFIGYKNPAEHPYEVVSYSMNNAIDKLLKTTVNISPSIQEGEAPEENAPKKILNSKLRPWLQDFDMGAIYTAPMIMGEIKAVTDSFCLTEPTETEAATLSKITGPGRKCEVGEADSRKAMYGGWMLWDPTNNYTPAALGL